MPNTDMSSIQLLDQYQKKRIWIDISNSPHVMMFADMIADLEKLGYELIITSRPLANTIDLLQKQGISHVVIGAHYGKNILRKIIGYPIRCLQLYAYLKDKKISAAISQSSFHSPFVANMLGMPSIYTNDNEHALGNIFGLLFAKIVYFPESMKMKWWMKFLPLVKNKIKVYPGIKETIYLWRKYAPEKKSENHDKPHIYIRPEPRTAQYYKGKVNFMDNTIIGLLKNYSVTILSRDEDQRKHYSNDAFNGAFIPEKPMAFENIVEDCDLFIGGGGSMTREMAISGISTISVYQDDLLEVDKYLIRNGILQHELNPENIDPLKEMQRNDKIKNIDELMRKGRKAYQLIMDDLIGLSNQKI